MNERGHKSIPATARLFCGLSVSRRLQENSNPQCKFRPIARQFRFSAFSWKNFWIFLLTNSGGLEEFVEFLSELVANWTESRSSRTGLARPHASDNSGQHLIKRTFNKKLTWSYWFLIRNLFQLAQLQITIWWIQTFELSGAKITLNIFSTSQRALIDRSSQSMDFFLAA